MTYVVVEECYDCHVPCHTQRTNFSFGRPHKLPIHLFVLIVIAAVFFTVSIEIVQRQELAQAASFRAGKELRFAQEDPPKFTAAMPRIDRLGDHYLMLVNTAVAKHLDAQKIAQFDRSPYDGLAVGFLDAYETSPVPSLGAMQAQIAAWKNSAQKNIWPWVFLNRMIGADNAEGNSLTKVPYFQKFSGLDLDGKAGAQKDFLENWRTALRLARQERVPGIVCDLEFYNNYKAYDLAELARMTSHTQLEVLRKLEQLGAQHGRYRRQ